MLWGHDYNFGEFGFSQVPFLYADGKIYVKSDSFEVIAYDLYTGTILWKTYPHYGIHDGGSIDIYKGKLYLTGIDIASADYQRAMLFCLNASTGELLWKDPGVSQYGGLKNGIVIDQSTGYLYCTDSYRIFCIDVNNSPKP
jgi:outer membrane protein assembly factor BamB